MPLNLEPGATLRQYRITRLLGRGGMGEVYAADDTKLGRKVAIKILPATLAHDTERLRRFTQEAKAASALNHPSILTIYDVDEVDGHPFLVTEFIDGQTLRERLREGGLTLRESLEIAGQIANALGTAHAAGIVHRDVKPENIMLREDGHAKLVDFGLAKVEQEGTTSDAAETVAALGHHTTPGLVMGTTQYMSPEQARGLKVDARSDIFSLGVVLYEMAAGRPPFSGDTPSDVIATILHFDPPAIADAPPDLEHILRKALEKDRDERHQTAKDLAADLKRLRRRLDPSADASRSSTGQGAASWTPTPKSGGTASPSAASGSAAATATPAVVTPPWTSIAVRFVWLSVAAFGAVTAIGLVGCLGLVGISWLQRDNDADERAEIDDASFANMTIEKVSGLGQVRNPALSNDGKLLAYVSTDAGQTAIWLRQMATGSVLKVAGPTPNTIADLQFTPEGHFLYYSERTPGPAGRGALMASPAFGGAAREILEGRFGRVSFAPDGKRFAVVRTAETVSELLVLNTNASGPTAPIGTRPFPQYVYLSPAWSPSGRHLAVLVAERPAETGIKINIQIITPEGKEPRTLIPSGSPLLADLEWASNDDALIATAVTGSVSSPPQLILIRASDGQTERVTQDINRYSSLSFSRASGTIATVQGERLGSIWIGPADRPEEARELPSRLTETDGLDGLSWLDNRQLVFTRFTDVPGLWIVNDDGSGARRLTEKFVSINPTASPDGRLVLFESDRSALAVPEVHMLSVSDGRVTQLTHKNGAMRPALSSDGRTLFFVRQGDAPVRLLRMPIEGGPATTVLEAAGIRAHDVSPDGSLIAAVITPTTGAARNIVLLPTGGGQPRTLHTTNGINQRLRWYPSGNALLLLNTQGGQSNLFRLDIGGGPPRQLTRFTRGTIDFPAISPDGRRIAYHRGSQESNIVLLKPRATE